MTRRRWTLATLIFLPCGLTLAVVFAATPGSEIRRTLADRPSPEIPRLTWPIGAGPAPHKRRMSAEQAGRVHLALAWDALRKGDWNGCLAHAAIASDLREGDPEAERLTWIAEDRIATLTRTLRSRASGRLLVVRDKKNGRWLAVTRNPGRNAGHESR
ncbi:MAG: hypothetical protein V3T86_10555 [Planctomycetota bacterium]